MQWRLEQLGATWTIQNVGNGKYLNISEEPCDNARVIATDFPREWFIQPDEEDPSVLR